ncbi:MAG TPA: transcriptional repressor LexA [Polyangiaceae bacterium LLY-WYZ-15_(1-7)]|nr:repressor LexA [Myxococcales bacterium]MAT28166.1 repressor LexA [Sandaracinus sp.]HJK92509.1 transcriptional repressor LexA [Polyangiaceae bacterium LLY-WYZ-15_(1-7)]HJL04564.1 transcriptional repressor LexA [Polyangiaceae bacterium LLY-WYZ-15_(1-7)]HJL07346.1 transcriptional repressor LexA [Polyangiaceae bacterium LLY-WYZ-15_(1-7)]
MQKLTDRQRAVLEYISDSIDSRGYPPTLREIGNHLGIKSTNGVNDHLRALERKGYLTREDMKSRTLRLLRHPDGRPIDEGPSFDDADMIEIPIVGRVAAGALTEAIEEPEDRVRIDRMLVGKGGDVFGLRISGESMIEAGIHDGDYVFVRKQLTARRGDIVIALVGDEATCKRYFPEKDHIRLQPENSTMAPILVPKNDWRETQILGVVVGVYRKLAS